MRTRIKICGVTRLEDALAAVAAGADALGFVFHRASPRCVEPGQAREIIRNLPPLVTPVGVFVNRGIQEVRRIAEECGLQALQFHGDESPEYCDWFRLPVIKAVRVRGPESLEEVRDYAVGAVLLDAYDPSAAGGTGRSFDWEWGRGAAPHRPLILAGGLTPENVAEAVAAAAPFGVDVSTGVESTPGRKDPAKVRAFAEAVRRADAERSRREGR